MQENDSHNAKKVLLRLREMLRVRTDIELSKIMDVQPSTISTWKKRNSLDYSSIIELCRLYKIDMDYLFFGERKEDMHNFSGRTPLVTRETLHEYTLGEFNENISDLPSYSLPYTNGNEFRVFQIISNNLFPVLEENAFAICEKKDIDELIPEDIVVVVSRKKGFFVSHLKKEGDDFILLNENQTFDNEPLKIHRTNLDETWVVRGKICYDLQSGKSLLTILNNKLTKIENIVSSSGV